MLVAIKRNSITTDSCFTDACDKKLIRVQDHFKEYIGLNDLYR